MLVTRTLPGRALGRGVFGSRGVVLLLLGYGHSPPVQEQPLELAVVEVVLPPRAVLLLHEPLCEVHHGRNPRALWIQRLKALA